MTLKHLPLAITLIFTTFVSTADPLELNISTSRGDKLDVRLHQPLVTPDAGNSELSPALVIGSGRGYHMDLPLIKGLAIEASKNGILAIRFNWAYFSRKGKPSETGMDERQDLEAVLGYVRNLKNVDQSKILVAGKSMGTRMAYHSFISDPSLHSLYLLTPLCSYRWDEQGNEITPYAIGKEQYPELLNMTRPVHFTLGANDPLCDVHMLYDFLKGSKGNITTTMFAGDHSMNLGKWDDPKFESSNAVNVSAAIQATVHWMKTHLKLLDTNSKKAMR